MEIRAFQSEDEQAVIALWQQCDLLRPQNDPHKDILRKMAVRPDLFLVGILDGQIIASVMAGYDGHRGWLNYVAVAPDQRRVGLGRAIIAEAERLLKQCGCAKINLQVRTANTAAIEFYEKIGYAVDDCISMGKRLENDQ